MNAIIVDFDGTLADSFDEVLAFLLTQLGDGVMSVSVEERQELRNLSMKGLAQKLGIPSWKLPLVYFRGRAYMHERMDATGLFSGMREVLHDMDVERCQLYIMSSNSHRNIIRFLRQNNLRGYFRRVYGNAGWFGKGGSLTRLLQMNHLKPEQTIYVGDETRDIAGAHAAGMAAVAVTWGFGTKQALQKHKPLAVVDTPAELTEVLKAWLHEKQATKR